MVTFLPLLQAGAGTLKTLLWTFRVCTYFIIYALKRPKNSIPPPVPKPPSRPVAVITSDSPGEKYPPPISRLHPELLAAIVSGSLPLGPPFAKYKRLVELSLVCVGWHDVIEDDPRFWCFASLVLPQQLLLKILSKSSLLDVRLTWYLDPLPWEEEWLRNHRRWRRLSLTCATAVTNRLVAVLNPSALETVFICGIFGRMEPIAHFATAPALRELHLDEAFMDWDAFPYTRLKVLKLDYGRRFRPAENHVSLPRLMAILGQNPELEILRLNWVYPNMDEMDEHTTIPQVDLPRLEQLELNLPSRQGLLLLSSINCRPGVLKKLQLFWRNPGDSDALTLKAAAAVVQKATPAIREATTLTVALIAVGSLLICHHADGVTGFKLTLWPFPLEDALRFIRLLAKCLPRPIPLSLSITSCRVRFDDDEVFGAIAGLPNVRKLRINHTGIICPFTQRLGLPLPSRGDDEVRWPLPRLTSFSYQRGNCTVKHVAEMLQARYAARKPEGEAKIGTGKIGANIPLPLDSFAITKKKFNDDGESRLLLEKLVGKERIKYL